MKRLAKFIFPRLPEQDDLEYRIMYASAILMLAVEWWIMRDWSGWGLLLVGIIGLAVGVVHGSLWVYLIQPRIHRYRRLKHYRELANTPAEDHPDWGKK